MPDEPAAFLQPRWRVPTARVAVGDLARKRVPGPASLRTLAHRPLEARELAAKSAGIRTAVTTVWQWTDWRRLIEWLGALVAELVRIDTED